MTSEQDKLLTAAAALAMGAVRNRDDGAPGGLLLNEWGVFVLGPNNANADEWAPLENSQQAFDLMVALDIDIEFGKDGRVIAIFAAGGDATSVSVWLKHYKGDKLTCARRVIVRAAAAIHEGGVTDDDEE